MLLQVESGKDEPTHLSLVIEVWVFMILRTRPCLEAIFVMFHLDMSDMDCQWMFAI